MTISHWSGEVMTDELINQAIERYLPALKSAGVTSFRVMRVGTNQCCAIAEYPDELTAEQAGQKISDLRAQTAYEFSWKMTCIKQGKLIA